MAHYQVVRKTHCEQTTGYPKLLTSMVDYVGFSYLPEYQVSEIPRDYGQTFYRAIVWIRGEDGGTVHKYEVAASSVDMAVHLAAYDADVALRRDYYCFNHPPLCYVPYFTYTDSQTGPLSLASLQTQLLGLYAWCYQQFVSSCSGHSLTSVSTTGGTSHRTLS